MSSVGYDMDDMPVYRLGQVIPQEKCGGRIETKTDHVDLAYAHKYKPYAAVKETGEVAVGLVGDVFMVNDDFVESVLVVFGPEAENVEIITVEKIFKLHCDLGYPEGYRGPKPFDVSAACQKYWDADATRPAA